MKAAYTYKATIDLRKGNHEFIWDTIANVGDSNAHQFAIKFIGPNGPVNLTGAGVTLYVTRSYDNATVMILGSVEDGFCVASLDDTCYAYEGTLKCTMVVSIGDSVISGVRVWIRVGTSATDTIVDPGGEIPSIQELIAQIGACRQATQDAVDAAGQASDAGALALELAHQAQSIIDTSGAVIPVFSVGTVSTLPSGSSATVTVTGTSTRPVLNFGIPEGQAGSGDVSSVNNIQPVNGDVSLTDSDIPSAVIVGATTVNGALSKLNTRIDTVAAEIPDVNIVFSSTEPSDPVEGMIWLKAVE